MSRVLPILFNTEMVRAILDGRKTVTRRIVKQSVWENFVCEGGKAINYLDKKEDALKSPVYKAPYQTGDILYIRETWANLNTLSHPCYYYKASNYLPEWALGSWKPSIHMPKEAARIWLMVTDVRVERLQDIDDKGAYREGAGKKNVIYQKGGRVCEFAKIWNSTIDKKQLNRYGWQANPWVWVIEFEWCEKPEE